MDESTSQSLQALEYSYPIKQQLNFRFPLLRAEKLSRGLIITKMSGEKILLCKVSFILSEHACDVENHPVLYSNVFEVVFSI